MTAKEVCWTCICHCKISFYSILYIVVLFVSMIVKRHEYVCFMNFTHSVITSLSQIEYKFHNASHEMNSIKFFFFDRSI